MLHIIQESKEQVLSAIKNGRIEACDVSQPNFIDGIILKMEELGVINGLIHIIDDRRTTNTVIPLEIIWILAITSKMKVHTSLTDIPYAIMDSEVLSRLGYTLYDTERDIANGLMSEGTIRNLLGKYAYHEIISGYNKCVQSHILPKMKMEANIHILDCTELEVELSNKNYEESGVVKIDGETRRGYKLSTLRGLSGDSGIIEEICFGAINTHDLELSRNMILNSPMLKPQDLLINDRGFLSREILNELKIRRKVDTYIPLRNNMLAYQDAVSIAKTANIWKPHPNRKRKTQQIALVENAGLMWESEASENDVPLNACVVWDKKDDDYYVFVTTDISKSAKQIIQTYELRPEIEEDYRQLKDFWQLEDFKSTKIDVIAFHIICTLMGYFFFQLYVCTDEGECWLGKTLPVIIKKYIPPDKPKSVIVYTDRHFAVFPFIEFLHLYASLEINARSVLDAAFSVL